jgi:ABC transporter substrate binding protein
MTLLADLEAFVDDHRPHGAMTADATPPAWNGDLLTVVCPCGVVFERWVTPGRQLYRLDPPAFGARPSCEARVVTSPGKGFKKRPAYGARDELCEELESLTARLLKREVLSLEVQSAGEIARAFRAATEWRADALIVIATGLLDQEARQVVARAAAHRLPAMYSFRNFYMEEGPLISYGVDLVDIWRRAATYVGKILKGAKPPICPWSSLRNSSLSSISRPPRRWA